MLNPFKAWVTYTNNIKKYKRLQESLNLILSEGNKSKTAQRKSVYKMSTDEFYDYLVEPKNSEVDKEVFFQFLFEYLVTGFMNGDITKKEMQRIMGIDNPLKINRYVDKMLRNIKMQGSLLDELMRYQNDPEKSQEIYSMILPDYAYDKENKKLKIKNLDDIKKIIGDSVDEMQKQKKDLAMARMQAEEKRRLEEWRKGVLVNSPEIAQLLGKDGYMSEEEKLEDDARIIYTEVEKQRKGTIIRKAVNPERHTVISKETSQMSPSELIAYKKKLLSKLRRDIDQNNTGMDVKI